MQLEHKSFQTSWSIVEGDATIHDAEAKKALDDYCALQVGWAQKRVKDIEHQMMDEQAEALACEFGVTDDEDKL